MKVKADSRPAHGETLDQDAGDECFRGKLRQGLVERQHDGAVEAGGGEEPQFGGFIGQPKQRLAGIEKGARVRLKGQRRRRAAKRCGPRLGGGDDGFMTAMHAIEIADGDHRAAQSAVGRKIAHEAEILRRHRLRIVNKRLRNDPGVVPSPVR